MRACTAAGGRHRDPHGGRTDEANWPTFAPGDRVYGTVRDRPVSALRRPPRCSTTGPRSSRPIGRARRRHRDRLQRRSPVLDRSRKVEARDGHGAGPLPAAASDAQRQADGQSARFAAGPDHCADYRAGYLCGMIRGDGHLASSRIPALRAGGRGPITSSGSPSSTWRGCAAPASTSTRFEVATTEFVFAAAAGRTRRSTRFAPSAATVSRRSVRPIRFPRCAELGLAEGLPRRASSTPRAATAAIASFASPTPIRS